LPPAGPAERQDEPPDDAIERVPAGGGFRILRCPRLLDADE
jgi:hypothetical protein